MPDWRLTAVHAEFFLAEPTRSCFIVEETTVNPEFANASLKKSNFIATVEYRGSIDDIRFAVSSSQTLRKFVDDFQGLFGSN